MKKKLLFMIVVVGLVSYFCENKLFAGRTDILKTPPAIEQIEPITQKDRILIMSPHPDDESLGTAGIIQKALKAGAEVRVMYLTNGEHNQLAFIVYEKRLVFKTKGIISMGELRRQEAAEAVKLLGVPEKNTIFLGYPDFGTLAILQRYWGDVKPFKSLLFRISSVPYPDALSPNAPYKGESILHDIESALVEFKPTKIFVTSPADTNRDHRAYYLFLRVALWDLKGKFPAPKVYPYLIHCYGWPYPRNYHPDFYVGIPKQFADSQIKWVEEELSPDEVKKKHEAILLHKSQCADSAFYLNAFARRDELFGDYPDIELSDSKDKCSLETTANFREKAITYCKYNGKLFIKIIFKTEPSRVRRFYVSLLGHSSKTDFSKMPKIKIYADSDRIRVLERGKFIKMDGLEVAQTRDSATLIIPLKSLGDPEHILSSVDTYIGNPSTDFNAWRVLDINE